MKNNEDIAVVLTDLENNIVWVNNVFQTVTGYTFDNIHGKSTSILLGKNTERPVLKRIKNKLKSRAPFHERITKYRKNGEEFTCALTAHPVFNSNSELTNYIVFAVDNNFVSLNPPPFADISWDKYERSGLKEKQEKEIFFQLNDFFREKKPYLNPRLTLRDIAAELDTNTKYLSQTINHQTGKNFRFFINKFRVQHFEHLLSTKQDANLTLFGMAKSCGFNNKATFHKVILNHTGTTPKTILDRYK